MTNLLINISIAVAAVVQRGLLGSNGGLPVGGLWADHVRPLQRRRTRWGAAVHGKSTGSPLGGDRPRLRGRTASGEGGQ